MVYPYGIKWIDFYGVVNDDGFGRTWVAIIDGFK